MSKKRFPKEIFVQWRGEGDGEYLQPSQNIDELDGGLKVAIYELKEIKAVKITTELE